MPPSPAAIDLLDPRLLADPWAAYDALRERAPVHEMPGLGFFVVTSHAGVEQALGDPERFSPDLGEPDLPGFLRTAEARAVLEQRGIGLGNPLRKDARDAGALRASLAASVVANASEAEPFVRAIVRDLLRGLGDRGACDFVSDVCGPLPLMVAADRLGLPLDDLPKLQDWTRAWVRMLCYAMTPELELEVATRRRELRDYLAAQLAARRDAAERDLLSALVRIEPGDDGGGPLDDGARPAIAEELLVGGNDATSDGLASGMLLLLRDPGLVQALRADVSRIGAFVDEVLRLETPVTGVMRRTTRDTELLGTQIGEGRMVHLRFAAANRDPAVFVDPHRLDLERPNRAAQLAFGGGSQRCPGLSLARLQMQVAFEELLARWQEFELAVDETELAYLPSFTQRGLCALPLRFRVRPT